MCMLEPALCNLSRVDLLPNALIWGKDQPTSISSLKLPLVAPRIVRCKVQLCPPCNTVRSGHFCICNRVRAMQKPSCGDDGCTGAR